jgi:hypothetical protein
LHQWQSKKGAEHGICKSRQSVPESQQGLTEQNQGGSERHQQQVLDHVDSQQVMIVGNQWRS